MLLRPLNSQLLLRYVFVDCLAVNSEALNSTGRLPVGLGMNSLAGGSSSS